MMPVLSAIVICAGLPCVVRRDLSAGISKSTERFFVLVSNSSITAENIYNCSFTGNGMGGKDQIDKPGS